MSCSRFGSTPTTSAGSSAGQGRTAGALRTVVGALAGNNNVRVDIVDTDRTR